MKTQRPKRNTSGRPARREAQYIAVAPSQEPMVPAATIPAMLKLPLVCARCAAGGITSSLGSGTTELSIAMRSTMRA